jgi:uncharacterized lipoprotein YddW (UPF0748 family)
MLSQSKRLNRGVLGLLAGCSALLVGCHGAPKMIEPMRAVWVTRMDYKTPDDIRTIMDNCKSAGFNAVLFQVRGNGTVSYPSKIEPWAEQFDFKNPGYDPLATAITEARARHMQLHAWVNVMPGWRGPNEPSDPKQLYLTHPEWFWYDAEGKRQPLNHVVGDKHRGWYASVNPCLPEVRDYLVGVFRELVSNYDVDGLHLDYIRFPNESVVPGEKIPDYPRDARTLALYKKATGKTPDDDPAAWNKWREDQVTTLVGQIHKMIRKKKPHAVLTSSVGCVRENGLKHFQDAQTWLEKGYVDGVFLMDYTPDVTKFNERIDPWLQIETHSRVIPGMMVRRKKDPTADVQRSNALVDAARDRTGDFCVFAYSSIFGPPARDAARAKNDAVRQGITAHLAELAKSDGD